MVRCEACGATDQVWRQVSTRTFCADVNACDFRARAGARYGGYNPERHGPLTNWLAPRPKGDAMSDTPYQFEVVPLTRLTVDHDYQRPLGRLVDRLVNDFQPRLLGTLVCNKRTPRLYSVIDGQTRLEALRILGHQDAPCLVYNRLTVPEEAGLFVAFQRERRQISALDAFRASLVAENADAIALKAVVEQSGFVIEKSNLGNSIAAIRALEDSYQTHGGETVGRALAVIAGAYEFHDRHANTNEFIRGLCHFLGHTDNVDDTELIAKLSEVEAGTLLVRAAQLRQGRGHGGKSPLYMAEVLRDEYRRRRPRGR